MSPNNKDTPQHEACPTQAPELRLLTFYVDSEGAERVLSVALPEGTSPDSGSLTSLRKHLFAWLAESDSALIAMQLEVSEAVELHGPGVRRDKPARVIPFPSGGTALMCLGALLGAVELLPDTLLLL